MSNCNFRAEWSPTAENIHVKHKTEAVLSGIKSIALFFSPKGFGGLGFCAALCFSSQVAAISSENNLSHERLTHSPLNCFLYDAGPLGLNSTHRSESDSQQDI